MGNRLLLLGVAVAALGASAAQGAQKAVLECQGDRSWYGAYLLPAEDGGDNLATLRAGLTVEIVRGGSQRQQVKLVTFPDPTRVIVHREGWPGAEPPVGWVSTRFLRVLAEQAAAPAPTSPDPFAGLNRTQPQGGAGQGRAATGASPSRPAPALGPVGADPGDEPWRKELPNVYYVFADDGKDGNYWSDLAQRIGRTPRAGKDHIARMVAADVAQVGRPKTQVVKVHVTKADDLLKVLAEGRLPPPGGSASKVWSPDELQPAACNVVGLATLSHGSTDGPVFGDPAVKRQQIQVSTLLGDRGRGLPSLAHRLVKGARLSFFACNTGACQYYLDHPSLAHWAAALYGQKDVVARGKLNIGDPESPPSCYALFGRGAGGQASRLTPPKKDWLFYVPLAAKDGPESERAWVYEKLEVPFSTPDERDAILKYYRSRGVTPQVLDGKVAVRAPRLGEVSRSSTKDPFLLDVVRAVASRKPEGFLQRVSRALGGRNETDESRRLRGMLPELRRLLDDRTLQNIVETVQRENGGTLDPDDFRIWFRIYFANYDDAKDRTSIARRACLCDHASLGLRAGKGR